MPRRNIRIRLAGRAVDIALSPRRAGAIELSPEARGILQHAEIDRADDGARIVTCNVPQACAILDHFSGLVLSGLGDPDAGICADARDAVRRALAFAGT